MAEEKATTTKTKKTTTTKKKTAKKKTAKSKTIKLLFQPIDCASPSGLKLNLKTQEVQNQNGREVVVDVPRIDGLPESLIVKTGEVLEVNQDQYDQLQELGYVQTEEEAAQQQEFIDNLSNQHPDKLTYDQLSGNMSGFMTANDVNKLTNFKLTRVD